MRRGEHSYGSVLLAIGVAAACSSSTVRRTGTPDPASRPDASLPDARAAVPDGSVTVESVRHLLVRDGAPNRSFPSAVLRAERLAVAFATDTNVGVALEDRLGGEVVLRGVVPLDGNGKAGTRLVATDAGFELVAYSVWAATGAPRRLYRVSLDPEGHATAAPTTLSEHRNLACDAAATDALYVACAEQDDGAATLRLRRCGLGGGACESPTELATCAKEMSTPRIVPNLGSTEIVFGCDDGSLRTAGTLKTVTVTGGVAPPARVLVDGAGFGRGRPGVGSGAGGRAVAWLDHLYTFDGADTLAATTSLLELDASSWVDGASWDVAPTSNRGFMAFGAYGVTVFERGYGATSLCGATETDAGGAGCDLIAHGREGDGAWGAPATALVARGASDDLVYTVNTPFSGTDLMRAEVIAGGTVERRRPLLPPLGDLELECAECDDRGCRVLSKETTAPTADGGSSFQWRSVPADGGAAAPLGAPFETESGVVASCGTGGASLLHAFERDGACFMTLTWLPESGEAPWEVEVSSCNWGVFPERDAIRLISEDGANRVQRVVTRSGAGAESPLPGFSGPTFGGGFKRCGSSYFGTVRAPDALTETLLRFTPGSDAGFTAVAERTFDAAVSAEELDCDDRTVVLVVNQGGPRTVLELAGSELVPWSTHPGSTLDYYNYVAVHSGALWFPAYDAESQMSFITLDAHGTRTLATRLPKTYSKWIHSQSLSAGENLVVLWRTPEGDAWVSVW